MLINKYIKIKLEIKICCNKHIHNSLLYINKKYRSNFKIKQEYLKVNLIFYIFIINVNNMGGDK